MVLKNVVNKKNRALLRELVVTDFKLRYQGSVLGYAWSLLKPMFLFLILYVVFVKFLRIGASIPHYPIYLFLGIALWSFFSEMTTQSLTSIVDRGDLIRKIRIPRWIIVLSSSVSALINFGLNIIVVLVFMYINGVHVGVAAVWFPLILLEIYVFALGLSLLLSACFVKYRDISHIWEIILQGAFYLTPILYPLSMITNATFQKLLLLNPMAQAIQDARHMLVTTETLTIGKAFGNSAAIWLPLTLSLLVLLFGIFYFKREAKYFGENI